MAVLITTQKDLSLPQKITSIFMALMVVISMTIPQSVRAQTFTGPVEPTLEMTSGYEQDLLSKRIVAAQNRLVDLSFSREDAPVVTREVAREMRVSSTAYSSDVAQTDSTPCITADGFNVCENNIENVVAANFLPIGTEIQIPELFGDRVFTVHDRMNKRYYYKVDVWMTSRERAINYGLRNVKILILK